MASFLLLLTPKESSAQGIAPITVDVPVEKVPLVGLVADHASDAVRSMERYIGFPSQTIDVCVAGQCISLYCAGIGYNGYFFVNYTNGLYIAVGTGGLVVGAYAGAATTLC